MVGESKNMSEDNVVLQKWAEFKQLVVDTDLDLLKNTGGNAAAGVRTRRGLRHLKKIATDIVKLSTASDKANKVAKPKKAAAVT